MKTIRTCENCKYYKRKRGGLTYCKKLLYYPREEIIKFFGCYDHRFKKKRKEGTRCQKSN